MKDGTEIIQLITYDPRDNSQIVVKTICNYQENMETNKISASVLTGVYYIDVYKGNMKSVLYRIDRNEKLTRETVRADVLGNMEVIPREDRLIYEDKITNKFYIKMCIRDSMYPDKTPKEREDLIAKEKGAVFIMQIGGTLKSGKKHDGRSPDYDDWNLNGDIIFYYPLLERAFEVSSMGIRVDEESLDRQMCIRDSFSSELVRISQLEKNYLY